LRCGKFLEKLINSPTPGTREDAGQKLVRSELRRLCDRVETGIYGGVLGVVNPTAAVKVLLTAHVDEIALVVSDVDEKGFVYVNLLGGTRPDALVGQRVEVHTRRGGVPGVVGRRPGPAPEKQITVKDLWLDIGARDRASAGKLVRAGDPVTVEAGYRRLAGGRAAGRGMDDRCGVAAVVEAVRLIRAQRRRLKVGVYALSATQEEGGGTHRGAVIQTFRVRPDAAVAVDMTHARDIPGGDPSASGDCRLGAGPVISLGLTCNRKLNDMLAAAARARRIPLQYAVEPVTTGTDGDHVASVGGGVATAVVSIPCRYMHSPAEVISLKDVESTAKLLAGFVLRLPAEPDFRPF
jgi:endoglucanase